MWSLVKKNMSRVGKQPIKIESGVEVRIDNNEIIVKGPKGELKKTLFNVLDTKIEEGQVIITPKDEEKETNALWGLQRSLIANMIEGVSKGYEKKLELVGVGYRAQMKGTKLSIEIGFSHPVEFEAVDGITFEAEKTNIKVSGIDKGLVGQYAANIRKVRKPEPYKGKGIRYQGEIVRKKVGKKAGA